MCAFWVVEGKVMPRYFIMPEESTVLHNDGGSWFQNYSCTNVINADSHIDTQRNRHTTGNGNITYIKMKLMRSGTIDSLSVSVSHSHCPLGCLKVTQPPLLSVVAEVSRSVQGSVDCGCLPHVFTS